MTRAELEVENEIKEYELQLTLTQSPKRKKQLLSHIKKLKHDLLTYRYYYYNKNKK